MVSALRSLSFIMGTYPSTSPTNIGSKTVNSTTPSTLRSRPGTYPIDLPKDSRVYVFDVLLNKLLSIFFYTPMW